MSPTRQKPAWLPNNNWIPIINLKNTVLITTATISRLDLTSNMRNLCQNEVGVKSKWMYYFHYFKVIHIFICTILFCSRILLKNCLILGKIIPRLPEFNWTQIQTIQILPQFDICCPLNHQKLPKQKLNYFWIIFFFNLIFIKYRQWKWLWVNKRYTFHNFFITISI